MAEFRFGNAMPEFGRFDDFYDDKSLKLKSHSATMAVYEDAAGADIILTGTGFKFTGSHFKSGTVKAVEFDDDKGGTLVTVSGGNFQAEKVTSALDGSPSVFDFMSALSAGNDKIVGRDGIADNMSLGENHGNDTVTFGNAGGFVGGSEGKDTYKGGAGFDEVSFENTYFFKDDSKGIKANLATGVITDSWGDKDKVSGIEELRGSVYKDQITGSSKDDALMGLRGDDVIDGGKGVDDVRYHRDVLYGGSKGIDAELGKGYVIDGFGDKDTVKNIEEVYGTYQNDKFVGDDGDNQFRGVSGIDSFDGGKGVDAVNFYWFEDKNQHGVKADLSLSKNQITDDGFGNVETTKNIEALSGSQFSDTLKLGSDDGWAYGYLGDDTLIAGTGVQQFGGGAGKDTFVFASVATMGVGDGNRDYLYDFSQAEHDVIDFSGIGGLAFKGEGGKAAAGEVRFLDSGGFTFVYGSVSGGDDPDFQLTIKGELTLTSADFAL